MWSGELTRYVAGSTEDMGWSDSPWKMTGCGFFQGQDMKGPRYPESLMCADQQRNIRHTQDGKGCWLPCFVYSEILSVLHIQLLFSTCKGWELKEKEVFLLTCFI